MVIVDGREHAFGDHRPHHMFIRGNARDKRKSVGFVLRYFFLAATRIFACAKFVLNRETTRDLLVLNLSRGNSGLAELN